MGYDLMYQFIIYGDETIYRIIDDFMKRLTCCQSVKIKKLGNEDTLQTN